MYREWPQPVEEILLVGHSMGGLVIRAACHHGAPDPWISSVRHVVYLGSRHGGAPLARGVRMLASTAEHSRETRPHGRVLDHSQGVRDLRFGYLTDDDRSVCDSGTCRKDHGSSVPLIATANHCVVAATVTADPRHPTGQLAGDLLVQPASAHGQHRSRTSIPFAAGNRQLHGPMTHFGLLNRLAVYNALRDRLATRPGQWSTSCSNPPVK